MWIFVGVNKFDEIVNYIFIEWIWFLILGIIYEVVFGYYFEMSKF